MGGFFKKTVRDVPLDGKTVLVRADYNVPLAGGKITDDFRIKSSIPTLQYLLDHGCTVVIMSHLGRPHGFEDQFSLKPVAKRLQKLLGRPVRFVEDCKGDKVKSTVKRAPKGSVILLENLRFYPEEKANDAAFAKAIASASQARYFVQDGFGVVHRAHASTDAITMCLPSVAGLLLEKEYKALTGAISKPKRPFVAVLGGAKVSDKIGAVDAIEKSADTLLIGGAMANTFFAAKGLAVGKSKAETDQVEQVQRIYDYASKKVGAENIDSFVVLPHDVAVATSPDAKRPKVVGVDKVADDQMILDIGPGTIEHYADILASAGTVLWNGTMGFAENDVFAHGSARVALSLATQPETISIVGGGDTADFVLHWDSKDGGSFSHVSTGGGASLELLAGKKLPGTEALLDA